MEEKRERLRAFLKKHRLSYPWLIALLKKNGVETSRSELCEICIGRRVATKAEIVLTLSANIIDEYELFYERV